MLYSFRPASILLVAVSVCGVTTTLARADIQYTGVNLFGAEFGVSNGNVNLPGNYGQHYTYPTAAEVDYFVEQGMNVFRLPFRWERLQQSQFAALDATELSRMDNFVNYATSQGAHVILDPHNFMRYYPSSSNFQSSTQGLVGTSVPTTAFTDFWGKVADHYKDNDKVIFNLMNEPNTMQTADLVTIQNAAITAIRNKDAQNLILVPGNQWTGAWAWEETWYNGANSIHMLDIVDPDNNFAFDVHQYLDADYSGGSDGIVSETIGRERLEAFTDWLHVNNRRGFLGEFAVANSRIGTGSTQIGDEAIHNMLDYVEANDDVWLGWTWWASGPWWVSYMFGLEPDNVGQPNQGPDRAAMGVLDSHLVGNFVPELDADYNGDGKVSAADFTIWRDTYGSTTDLRANGNNIGASFNVIDDADFEAWKENYGVGFGAGSSLSNETAVPEPSTVAMSLLLAAVFVMSRTCSITVGGRF